jgi:cell wall-associated NlpC family hydrolase
MSADLVAKAQQYAADNPNTPYTLGGNSFQTGMDCSAFVWQVLGEPKGNRNTDWLVSNRDKYPFASSPVPEPGMLAVYGGKMTQDDGKKYGHVGIIVDPDQQIVVDCSQSQDGIRQRKLPILFTGPGDGRKAYFLRYLPAYGSGDGGGAINTDGMVPSVSTASSPLPLILLIALGMYLILKEKKNDR